MESRNLSVVLFEGFEVLDVFGPVEIFAQVPQLSIQYVAAEPGPIVSSQGAAVLVDTAFSEAAPPDIVLVPGGMGTRPLVTDTTYLDRLRQYCEPARIVTSVCTGSALLAAAGLLEGYRATSNKLAFGWASGQGDTVDWVGKARWVHDRDRWTSSGVAAGMDMAAALVASLWGTETAETIAQNIELELHRDASWDPFAALHGLD